MVGLFSHYYFGAFENNSISTILSPVSLATMVETTASYCQAPAVVF
jgi:hypothetical protein